MITHYKSLFKEQTDTIEIWVALSSDDYLYYTSSDKSQLIRLVQHQIDGEDPVYIYKVSKVPVDLADDLENMGTSDQKFSDGYIAAQTLMKAVPKNKWKNRIKV